MAPVRVANGDNPSDEAIDTCVANNVRLVCDRIKQESEILAGLAADGSIAIVGGVYNVATGEVDFTVYS